MNNCPRCGKPVPANEWISYRAHEDCAIGNLPVGTSEVTPCAGETVRLQRHKLGGHSDRPIDRRGGAGQDRKRGRTDGG